MADNGQASAAQIASARQLAIARGYDPALVTAGNADRANTAFPVQSGGYTGGANYKPPTTTTATSAPTAPMGGGGGSLDGLNKVVNPAMPAPIPQTPTPTGLLGGGGGDGGGGMLGDSMSALRLLGRRTPPMDMQRLPQRAY